MKRSKQSAAHFSVTSQDIANGLQRLRTYIRVTSFCLPFFLLCPKRLTYKTNIYLRKQFFKHHGEDLIKQINPNLPPHETPTRIKVHCIRELLDCFLEIKESNLTEPISNAQLAKIIDSTFDTELDIKVIINYIVNHRSKK
jgi:hypothetical protein